MKTKKRLGSLDRKAQALGAYSYYWVVIIILAILLGVFLFTIVWRFKSAAP